MFSWLPGWMRWAFALALIALIAVLFISPHLGDAESAWAAARRINPGLLLLATVAQIGSVLCQVQLTLVVLPDTHRPTFSSMARVEMATMAVSHTVPGGSAAGSAVAYRLLTQDKALKGREVGFALAIRGVGSAVVLNLILWGALLASIPAHGFHPVYTTAAVLGVVLIGTFGAAVWLLMRGGARTERFIATLASKLPVLDPERVAATLRDLGERLDRLMRDPRLAIGATVWSAGYWLLSAASLWIFVIALGSTPRPDGLLVAFGLANVLAALPITPRGLGLVEGVLIPSLVGFGVPLATATVAVIAWRLVSFWLPIPIGGLAYLSLKVRGPRPTLAPATERQAAVEELRETVDEVHTEVGGLATWAREHGLRVGDDEPRSGDRHPGPSS